MSTNSVSAAVSAAPIASESGFRALSQIYSELAKARLSGLVVITAAVGFALACGGPIDWLRLAFLVVGTALAAAGANAWNQWIEIERDARMERTRNRPLPSGRISRGHALGFALVTGLAGPLVLLLAVNPLTAGLALLCELVYVLIYTPLKPRSPLNTLVGAVCGAIPPMMGWTAVTNSIDGGAWILGGILFVWQIPHFLSLAWLYREDYARGGFRMLPIIDPTGRLTCQVVVLYSITLLPLGLMLTIAGLAGWFYAAGSLILGGLLAALGVRLYFRRDSTEARRLFLASIVYLPLLMGLMIADRTTNRGLAAPEAPCVARSSGP